MPSKYRKRSRKRLYLGILFIGAIVASLGLAAVLTRTSDQRAWVAAGGLAAAIMLGYVLTRTSGLPDATLDVGNWTEPLGLASLVAEGLVVCVTAGALASRTAVPRRAPAYQPVRTTGGRFEPFPARRSREAVFGPYPRLGGITGNYGASRTRAACLAASRLARSIAAASRLVISLAPRAMANWRCTSGMS